MEKPFCAFFGIAGLVFWHLTLPMFYFVTMCMILPRDILGLEAMNKNPFFTCLGWPKNEIIWKSLGCGVVNGVPPGSPVCKTLGAFRTSGFGLGTFLGTPFTTLPARLFSNNVPFCCQICGKYFMICGTWGNIWQHSIFFWFSFV